MPMLLMSCKDNHTKPIGMQTGILIIMNPSIESKDIKLEGNLLHGISNHGTFGQASYHPHEQDYIQQELDRNMGPEFVSHRSGPGGGKVPYIEGNKAIQIANEIFGFNGWSSSIRDMTVDFVDIDDTGRVSVGLSVICRVTLKDGSWHEDCGYGTITNAKDKGTAFEKSKKEACTDALKRTLKLFGNALGNCLSDKNFTNAIARLKAPPAPALNPDELYRAEHLRPSRHPSRTSIMMSQPRPVLEESNLLFNNSVLVNNLINNSNLNQVPPPPYRSPHPTEIKRNNTIINNKSNNNATGISFNRQNSTNATLGHFVNENSRKAAHYNEQEKNASADFNEEISAAYMDAAAVLARTNHLCKSANEHHHPIPQEENNMNSNQQQPAPILHQQKHPNAQSSLNNNNHNKMNFNHRNNTMQKGSSNKITQLNDKNDLISGGTRSNDNSIFPNQHQNIEHSNKELSINLRGGASNRVNSNQPDYPGFVHCNMPYPGPHGPPPPGAVDFSNEQNEISNRINSTTTLDMSTNPLQKQENNNYVMQPKRQRVD